MLDRPAPRQTSSKLTSWALAGAKGISRQESRIPRWTKPRRPFSESATIRTEQRYTVSALSALRPTEPAVVYSEVAGKQSLGASDAQSYCANLSPFLGQSQ